MYLRTVFFHTCFMLAWGLFVNTAAAVDFTGCCDSAILAQAYLDKSINQSQYICGQSYNESLPPAPNLEVTYGWCSSNCAPGGSRTQADVVDRLAPILQYILPAVVFSMTVPRSICIKVPKHEDWARVMSRVHVPDFVVLTFLVTVSDVLTTVIDFLCWVIYILIFAGPMLFSGLEEALTDYRIFAYLDDENTISKPQPPGSLTYVRLTSTLSIEQRAQILLAVVAGNLGGDSDSLAKLQKELFSKIGSDDGKRETPTQLLAIMSSQPGFGSAVGGPVLFYCCAFLYTLLDIQKNKGDTDVADSLAFGMWWMTIVHVAIVAGCLLASNNPNSVTATIGVAAIISNHDSQQRSWRKLFLEQAYPHVFQPVGMMDRGAAKMQWLSQTEAWKSKDSKFRQQVQVESPWMWLLLCLAALFFVFLPVSLAFWVEYMSPKRGLGCRTMILLGYFVSQLILTTLHTFGRAFHAGDLDQLNKSRKDIMSTSFTISYFAWNGVAVLIALVSIVSGTIAQVAGFYENCLCGVSASRWAINLNSATLYLATDTQEYRDSAQFWMGSGSTAVIFVAVMCYIAFRLQGYLRKQFEAAVDDLRQPGTNNTIVPTATAPSASSASSGSVAISSPPANHSPILSTAPRIPTLESLRPLSLGFGSQRLSRQVLRRPRGRSSSGSSEELLMKPSSMAKSTQRDSEERIKLDTL